MAQEIYHRSEWGNPTETWGNVYLNADLTNELYKRASEYENSWVTDQLLNGVGIKPSIILTPTAYEDGVLNSVKPAKTLGSELTNGVDNYDNLYGSTTVTDGSANIVSTGALSGLGWSNILTVGRKYKFSYNVTDSTLGQIKITGAVSEIPLDSSVGSHSIEFTSGYPYFNILRLTTCDITINNISLQLITDASFDFTRGSSATRVNELGLVQDVQILSGELVQNGDFEQIGSELVTNGGFDTDSDWTLPSGSSISGGSLNFDGTQTSGININQTLASLDLTKIYKVTFTISNYTAGQVRVKISNDAQGTDKTANGTYTEYLSGMVNNTLTIRGDGAFIGSIDNVSVKEVGQNWTVSNSDATHYVEFYGDEARFVSDTTSPILTLSQAISLTSGNKYRFSIRLRNNGGSGNVKVQASGLDFIPNILDGTYTQDVIPTTNQSTVSFYRNGSDVDLYIEDFSIIEITDDTDLPRINYIDGEGSLLLEPQSTNLVPYSEDFSQLSTATSGGTVTETANFSEAPNGKNEATRLQMSSASGVALKGYTIQGFNDYFYVSVYLKSNTSENQEVAIYGRNSVNQSYTVTPEWQRFEIACDGRLAIPFFYFGVRTSYGSDADLDILAWGVQAEQGTYATSYIPTNGSTVTRLADVCNNSGNSDLINSTEGVLYAEISALANDLSQRQISIDDGAGNNRIILRYNNVSNNINAYLFNGSVQGGEFNYVANDITEFSKIAFKYKQNDFALWVDGIERATDTSGNTFSADTLKDLSFDFNGNFDFYGNVKCVAVFKEALSDEELQKLTTI